MKGRGDLIVAAARHCPIGVTTPPGDARLVFQRSSGPQPSDHASTIIILLFPPLDASSNPNDPTSTCHMHMLAACQFWFNTCEGVSMVPIARRNLLSEKLRLAIAIGGVAFAVFLIVTIQSLYYGFRSGAGDFARQFPASL